MSTFLPVLEGSKAYVDPPPRALAHGHWKKITMIKTISAMMTMMTEVNV